MVITHIKSLTLIVHQHLKIRAVCALIIPTVISFSVAAGPTGGQIVGGAGHIHQSGLNTNIHQHTDRLAIDWETFNIDRNEFVNFEQPDRSSIVLNRIQDINPSQIQGTINANGQVIIANPNGVIFTKDSSVNVGGLFAAALHIDADEFMRGEVNFRALENTHGIIANEGTLQVIDGGTLALLGQRVENRGLLIAHFGLVALVAGSDIAVTFEEDSYLGIQISQNKLAEILRLDGTEILNSGIIQAFGGRVVLSAQQASAIYASTARIDESEHVSSASGTIVEYKGAYYLTGPDGDISDLVADEIKHGLITDTGTINTASDSGDAGTIVYRGSNIQHSGQINADSKNGTGGSVTFNAENTTLLTDSSRISAQSENGTGGQVQVLGNQVGLTDNARIDVSGTDGGGEVLIGGDLQGENKTIKNAEAVYLGEDTSVKADAIEQGNGGKIIVWSDDRTRAYGNLSATGGEQSGDGGFIETSSKNYADLQTDIDVSAVNGLHGTWLIDPSNLTISNVIDDGINIVNNIFESRKNNSLLLNSTLQTALANGANITVQTSVINDPDLNPEDSTDPDNSYGDITLAANLDFDNAGNVRNAENASSLTLRAHRDIIIDGKIFDSDSDNITGTADNPTFTPDGDVLNLTLQADWRGNGNINQTGTPNLGSVRINNDINLQGGNFSASGVDFIQAQNTTIDTRIPAVDTVAGSGFDPNSVFGAGAPTPAGSVTISAQRNASLGNITTRNSTGKGNLSVTANTGTITQNDTLDITGSTTLSTSGDITLDNPNNQFNGAVNIDQGAIVRLADRDDLTVNINDNSVTRIVTNTAGDSTINESDTTGTVLGTMTVGGNLDVTAAGDLTQFDGSTLTISNNGTGSGDGVSTLSVNNGASISLDNANTLNGPVNFQANSGTINNLSVNNTDAFTLQNNTSISGDLNLQAQSLTLNSFTLGNTSTLTLTANAGDIIQNSAINHAGTTILSASGDVFDSTMANNPTNNFSNLQINNATTATINNGTNPLTITGINNTDTLNINAQGINQTGDIIVTSTALLNAGTASANLANISARDLEVTGTAGINGTGLINISGNTQLDSGTANSSLTNTDNNFNTVDIVSAAQVTLSDANDLNIAGNMAGLNITSGLAGAASTVSNVADTALNVTGTSTFNLINGGELILDNFANTGRNNLQGAITLTNTTLDTVRLRNASGISLSALNIGRDLVLNAVGDISQSGAFNVNGNTTLQANNITLLQNNLFTQGVTITDSNVVQLTHSDALNVVVANNTQESATTDLKINATGDVGIEGQLLNLDINSTNNNIQNTAALTVSNNTTLDAGAGDIDFQTIQVNLENLDITQANRVQINETDNLSITQASVTDEININAVGPVSVNAAANTLNIDTNATITLSGLLNSLTATTDTGGIENGTEALNVANITTLNAGNTDINLTQTANDFNQVRIINARDVTLNDTTGLTLQAINSRDFTLTTQGNIEQAGGTQITSTRTASINSGNADILLGENNAFTALALTGNTATVVNNQSLVLNNSTLTDSADISTLNGDLSINRITATNNIRLSAADALLNLNANSTNISANSTTLQASAGIGRDSQINTQVSNLLALNTRTGDINIANTGGNITLNSIINQATDTGNFNFQSSNNVFINNITLQQNLTEAFFNAGTGTVNMFAADGSFLGTGTADLTAPDITATNLRLVGVRGTLGTIVRPVVLDISGKVELLMRASLNPIYAPPAPLPVDIQDNSIFRFISAETLSAVNGIQLTEVENLLDISPAIFTDIRHAIASDTPVMLPKDLLFEGGYTVEEDEEYFRQVTGEGVIGHSDSSDF